jgi:hypothetical protein
MMRWKGRIRKRRRPMRCKGWVKTKWWMRCKGSLRTKTKRRRRRSIRRKRIRKVCCCYASCMAHKRSPILMNPSYSTYETMEIQ